VTRLRGKVPVAPLDPARLARIEDQVMAAHQRDSARPVRAPWRLVTGGAVAACVALLAAGYVGWRVASPGGAPPVPSIVTAAGERARVDIDGAAVSVGESSRVSLRSRPDGAIIVDLVGGRVECEVAPRRAPFTVQAGDVSVQVVGTAFSVERAGAVRVRVTRGVVRVTAAGSPPFRLATGETWSSRAELSASSPGAPPSPSAAAPGGQALPEIPTSDPSPSPSLSPSPPSSDPPTPPSPTTRSPSPSRGSPASPRGRPRHAEDLHPAPGLPALTCDAVDPCRDIALQTTGPEAGQALYSLIHLELYRERDAGQAVTLAELYERRFARRRPREAEAVLWLRVLAHRESGELERSRAAARTYLERHPRGVFADQAQRITVGDPSAE
jgi:transmembrane sensor